jgi:hypothetical protein
MNLIKLELCYSYWYCYQSKCYTTVVKVTILLVAIVVHVIQKVDEMLQTLPVNLISCSLGQ